MIGPVTTSSFILPIAATKREPASISAAKLVVGVMKLVVRVVKLVVRVVKLVLQVVKLVLRS